MTNTPFLMTPRNKREEVYAEELSPEAMAELDAAIEEYELHRAKETIRFHQLKEQPCNPLSQPQLA